jgi:gliding motility-associated-like protein
MMDKIFTNLLIIGLMVLTLPLAAQQTPTFSIDPGSATIAPNGTHEVTVRVSDFQAVASMQFAVKWDPSIFEFLEIVSANDTDFPGLSDIPGVNISVPAAGSNVPAGQVNVSWFEPGFSGVTVSDDTEMFTFRLQAIDCGNTDISFGDPGGFIGIEILAEDAGGSLVDVGLNADNGAATVDGAGCGSTMPTDVTFSIDPGSATVAPNSTHDVTVRVSDFQSIASVQFAVKWDPNVFEFVEIISANDTDFPGLSDIPGVNISVPGGNVPAGQVNVSWFEPGFSGVTVSDDTEMFTFRLQAIDCGNTTISFEDPGPLTFIEILAEDSGGSLTAVGLNADNGTATVDGAGCGSSGTDELTGYIESVTVDEGDDFCLEVTVDNFQNILGMDFAIAYNDAMLSYTGISNVNPGLVGFLPASNSGNPSPGIITIQYFNQSFQPINLPNGAVLFEVCFTATNSGTSSVSFSDGPTAAIEFVDINEDSVPFTGNSGTATVNSTGGGGGGPMTTDLFLSIPNQTVDPGESFCVPVEVFNFDGVSAMSFVVEYDPNFLTFDEAVNFNTNLPTFSAASVGNPSPGRITVVWVEPTLQNPVSLPDESILFELCFTAEGQGVGTDISFTGDFTTPFEFIDGAEQVIPADSESGTITITGNFPGLTIEAEDLTVSPGEEFCSEVTVTNFEDIQGMSYAMTYDPNILDFAAITNLNSNLPGFTVSGNFSTGTPGVISVLWVDPTLGSVTLPDGEILYQVCFTAVGEDGQCDDIEFGDVPPTTVEITDSNEDIVDVFFEPGTICIDDNVAGQVQVDIGDATVAQGESFCLPVTTDNFLSITDFGFTIEYDEAHLQLDNVSNLNINLNGFSVAGNIDTSTPGIIAVSWSTPAAPQSLPDNAKLFDLCFTAIGDPNTSSDLTFTGSVEPISFISSVEGMMSFAGGDGTVMIQPLFNGFLLTVADETVQPGDNFCLPVTVLNFENVASFSFGICYDETQLEFQSVTNVNSNLNQYSVAGNFALPGQGQIPVGLLTTTWVEPSLTPVNLNDGEILFEVCFEAIGDDGNISDVTFCDTPTNMIEVTDGENEIEFNGEDGTVEISAIQPPSIASADVTNVSCNGEADGSINLMVTGGTGGPYSYAWSNSQTGSSITGLAAGSYTVTVTDNGNGGLTTTQTYNITQPSSALSLNGGVTAPSCSGGSNGSVTLLISGGTMPYNISWDNGIQAGQTQPTNLPAGTYCATITDANGCTVNDCFTVPQGVGGGPDVSADITDISCPGDNNGQITLSVSNANGGASFFWNTTPPSSGPQISNLSGGNYTVTVIDDANCRTIETYQVASVPPIQIAPIIEEPVCVGDGNGSIQVSASGGNGGFSYAWQGPSNFSSNNANINNLMAGTYNLTVTDANNCTQTASVTITEPSTALAISNIVPTPVNMGNDGALNLSVNGGAQPYNYSWSGPNNFSSTNEDLTGLNLGGEYCVTVTDARGCTVSNCATVENVLRINGSLITDACFDENNGAITLSVIGGVPPYNYNWNPGGATAPSLNNISSGNYSVTITDSDSPVNTITSTFVVGSSAAITVNPSVIPVQDDPGNTNGSIMLNAGGGTPPLSYSWSGPNDFAASTANISNIGTGTYCITITDSNLGNNCAWDTCFTVGLALPMSAPEVTAVGTTCSYTTDGVLTVTPQGGAAPYTITVTTATGEEITQVLQDGNSMVFENLPPGATTVSITDLFGNSVNNTPAMIGAPAPLQATIQDYQHATAGNCNGQVSAMVSGGTPGYTVAWSNGGGNGMMLDDLCGGFWYVANIIDANGCVANAVDSVFINEFEVTLADVVGTTCPEDESGSVDINVSGGDPGYTFSWLDENSNEVSTEEDPSNLPAGVYTVLVSEPSGNTLSLTVTIETTFLLSIETNIDSDYNGFDVSCPDAADGAASVVASGSAGYIYEWTNAVTNDLVANGATVDDLEAGTYNVLVSDENGCVSTAVVTLEAPDSIAIEGFVQEVRCTDGRNGSIGLDVSGGLSPYDYFWNNGAIDDRLSQLSPGGYTVTVLDDNNCESSATFTLANPAPIEVVFESEPATEGCNGVVFASGVGGTAPYTFNWENVSGSNDSPQQMNLCPGEYFVQVEDANGCLSALTSFTLLDRRFPCLDERVVITPDGDGLNEEFVIFCVEEYPDNTVEVYNRWGLLVFEAENYDNTWNGTDASGNPLPEGPYYYIIEYTDPEGSPRQQKGSLSILRED